MDINGVEHSRGKEKVGEDKRKNKDEVAQHWCFFCKDGGRLMFCDQEDCLKAYHPSCVNKDESFINSGKHWTCDVHFCFVCHTSPNLKCLACPKSLCKRCIGSVKFVQIKGDKGLCSSCLSLVLQVERNKDAAFDMPFERRFAGVWTVLREKENITPTDLSSADNRMKKNHCYISGFNLDVDAEHVKINKGKTPVVKRKKCWLPNNMSSVVAAEQEPELFHVEQESEMEGTGIYLGDHGIVDQDGSSRRFEIGSANNDENGSRKNHSATAKIIDGDRDIIVRDASSPLKFGSLNNAGIGEGNDHNAAVKGIKGYSGDEDVMGRNSFSKRIKSSENNDGIRKGDQGIRVRDASHCLKVGSSSTNGIAEGNDHNSAAKVTKGDKKILNQPASSKRTKRTEIISTGLLNDAVTEQGIPVNPIANVTKGNKEGEDSGLPFDEQAEAIQQTRRERYNWDTDEDLGWNVIVSSDGIVKGPYPLHSLKCLQDIYTFSSFLKVFKHGESKETAIPLGDALKLLSA